MHIGGQKEKIFWNDLKDAKIKGRIKRGLLLPMVLAAISGR